MRATFSPSDQRLSTFTSPHPHTSTMQVEVDPTEDTEWNDILRSHGIIPERPPSPSVAIEEALGRALESAEQHRYSDKSDSELDDLLADDPEGDEAESEFIASYRAKRLAELQSLQARVAASNFGAVLPVAKPEYQAEVTDASNKCFVFVHLSLPTNTQSKLLAALFDRAAKTFPEVKFVDIQGARAIENYPDRNCPTLLVYKDGDVKKQYVTLALVGGNSMRIDDLERILVDVGAVKESDRRLSDIKRARDKKLQGDAYYDSDDERNNADDEDDDLDD
ncbi:thioredoxin-like protein [Myxozyma melibiosi]|uniref:Thioredoxin-like protein n=1 Tax=Myxozyma melibiosi TaxID=54550 RepID=A0ABR1FFU8_9ASCO